MRGFSDNELITAVSHLPTFSGFPFGPLDICVRSDADDYDKFDDKFYTYDCFGDSKEPVFRMVAPGTTNAGSFGLLQFAAYNPLGCAVLCADTIVKDSHAYGLHKGKPAYRQVRGFPYTRDNNKNRKAENYGPVKNEIILADRHRAGKFSVVIYNWSTACLVNQKEDDFLTWLKLMNQRPLSVAILQEGNI